jgi:hypothetical protein
MPPSLSDDLAAFVQRGQRAQAAADLVIAAAELRRQEFARLAAAVTPTLEALRSLTPGPFREQTDL